MVAVKYQVLPGKAVAAVLEPLAGMLLVLLEGTAGLVFHQPFVPDRLLFTAVEAVALLMRPLVQVAAVVVALVHWVGLPRELLAQRILAVVEAGQGTRVLLVLVVLAL